MKEGLELGFCVGCMIYGVYDDMMDGWVGWNG